jgi:hypothetical protein
MGFYDDLMALSGDFMGFHNDLMGFNVNCWDFYGD